MIIINIMTSAHSFESKLKQMNMRQKVECLLGWHYSQIQILCFMTLLPVIKIIFAMILIFSLTSEALTY